jgi:serine/threonine protein kinase
MANKIRKWGVWEAKENSFARGGQGLVYRVQDTSFINPGNFVLKELLNPKRSERFSNEIKAITLLSKHPHVIDIVDYGAFKDPEKPTYVMPEADENLESYIKHGKEKLNIIETLLLFSKIVSGVQHLHNSGIVHRDIKPDNVLMFSEEPKISDFGLCLIVDMPRVTETQEAVGPRYYMAPELEDGFYLDVDFKSDIYSLGKILYFLLSGGLIFSREKFDLKRWNLGQIYNDPRYEIFNLIFQNTIIENKNQRVTCSELMDKILDVQRIYSKHPLTTLEDKIPEVLVNFDGTRQQLSKLDDSEWVELLKIRKSNKAAYSKSVISVAFNAITENTAELFFTEIANFYDEVNQEEMRLLASKLITFHSRLMFMKESDKIKIINSAVEHEGKMGVNFAAKIFNLKEPEILNKLALRIDDLEAESLESLLISSMNLSYENREKMLLQALKKECSQVSQGFIVAGLMHEGSDAAIDTVAEIFRGIESVKKHPELYQALILSQKGHENVDKLVERGGYNDEVKSSLEIVSGLSKKLLEGD